MQYVSPPNFAETIVVKCSMEVYIFPRVFHNDSLYKLLGGKQSALCGIEN